MLPVRIGFIGAGDVADLHAEGIRACLDAELVGLWTRSSVRANRKSSLYGCRIYESPEALVSDPDVDAVVAQRIVEACERSAEEGRVVGIAN